MSIFDRLRKKKEDTGDEETSIYKDEAKPNRLASFMFGFFALLLTLLIAGGLFFGVRAIYRAIHGSDNPSSSASQPEEKGSANSEASDAQKKNTNTSGGASGSSGSTGSPSSTPSTGDNLPNTGDNLTLPKTGDPGM